MRARRALVGLLAGACLASTGAFALPVDARRNELSDLRERIEALQKEISRGEESHGEAADALMNSERAISSSQRRLREIAARREEIDLRLAQLREEKAGLEARLAGLRKKLGDTLFRLYVEGGQGGAKRFLSGDDPNQIARDALYLERIARQRLEAVSSTRQAMARLESVASELAAQREELVGLEESRKGEQASLRAEQERKKAVLLQISAQLSSQRKQMETLQHDEARMEKLIQGLERIAREQAEARARAESRARAAAAASLAAQSAVRDDAREKKQERTSEHAHEPSVGQASALASAQADGQEFARMKGQLGWPVRGALQGRFGTPRGEGGTNWRGVFVRAQQGAEVHAVARGTIVFADWLRGFGNLVIVDHGGGYMSVYGNNDAILKSTGDTVRGGETIATVGSSGGRDESGLYFEIRYRGQPQDPAKWMAAR